MMMISARRRPPAGGERGTRAARRAPPECAASGVQIQDAPSKVSARRRAACARCRSTRCPPSRRRRTARCGTSSPRVAEPALVVDVDAPVVARGRLQRRPAVLDVAGLARAHGAAVPDALPAVRSPAARYERCSVPRSRDPTTHEKRGRSTSIPIGSALRSTRRSSSPTRPCARRRRRARQDGRDKRDSQSNTSRHVPSLPLRPAFDHKRSDSILTQRTGRRNWLPRRADVLVQAEAVLGVVGRLDPGEPVVLSP